MNPTLPPVIGFVAPSGTGKTTLMERVIGHLVASGLKVAAIK
ncbi:MAG: molybdopterin-guanine dinucleotide biosynthesis protein MobB, partial [Magnetococcales bacterium]|nr:molybdopterin-guanine dinucleotide biosynthesis protein MobB [Magnetococcales bacterium]